METTIIECAKIQAETQGKNRWTNSLKNGVIINKGDFISVEGIAINSVGVGGNIIEIPDRIIPNKGVISTADNSPPNDEYEPNCFGLEIGFYIHHNYEDTAMMPLQNMTDATGTFAMTVNTTQENPNLAGSHNPAYGYILPRTPDRTFQTIKSAPQPTSNNQNQAIRYYWVEQQIETNGTLGEKDIQPIWTIPSPISIASPPSEIVAGCNMSYTTNQIRLEVDKGYDSPENVATEINKQMNAGWVRSGEFQTTFQWTENVNNGTSAIPGLQITKGSMVSVPTNGYALKQTDNYAYRMNFYKNPNWVGAGYNLINPETPKAIMPSLNDITKLSCESDILLMGNIPNNNAVPPIMVCPAEQLVLTNIQFFPDTLRKLKELFYSQDGFEDGLIIDPNEGKGFDSNDASIGWDYLKKNPEVFYRRLTLGRKADSAITGATAVNNLITATSPYLPHSNPQEGAPLTFFVSYTEKRWDDSILPDVPDGTANIITGYKKVDKYLDGGGNILECRKMAKAFNLNIVAVQVETTDGRYDDMPFVAIPLRQAVPLLANIPAFFYGDYCLYDPAFTRSGNEAVKMIGHRTYAGVVPATPLAENYEVAYQIGAPNPTFQFNESLGRFQMSNLHFPYYTGSGSSATGVGDALTTILKMNSNAERFLPDGMATTPISCLFARSGIGITNYLLKSKLTGRWDIIKPYFIAEFSVDGDTSQSVNPEDYWKNNLFDRLGWSFSDLFPAYGNPSYLFSQNTYGKYPTLTLYNPVNEYPNTPDTKQSIAFYYNQGVKPLTTNPYFSNAMTPNFNVNNAGQPMLNNSYQNGVGFAITTSGGFQPTTPTPASVKSINITADSDSIVADRLPRKLEYPYWLVYSDIIGNVKFFGENGKPNNIMAVANRAYTAGDFAFNFATDYVFKATRDFVITQITTEIYNPDYTKSIVDDGTIILYKIQHPLPAVAPLITDKTERVQKPQTENSVKAVSAKY